MFVTQFQKAVTYIKDTQGMALFSAMAKQDWLVAFRASPLFYVILPFIGLLLTLTALMNGYQLAKASNRNFDRWFLFISSMVCTVLASISLYGGAVSMAFGLSFVAGPWFFFSSLIGILSYQVVVCGINLYRVLESPSGSIQRMHYIQGALSNLFAMTISVAAVGALVFVMLSSVAPIIGSACAVTAVALTFFDLLWRIIPHNGKHAIKEWLHLGKPDLCKDATVTQEQILKPTTSLAHEGIPPHYRLFTHADYSATIRNMDVAEAKSYLTTRIQYKLNIYGQSKDRHDEKTKDKVSLLKKLVQIVKNPIEVFKKDMLAEYPLAFQSFWAEKGEIEQLFDAVVVLQGKYQQNAVLAQNLVDDEPLSFLS